MVTPTTGEVVLVPFPFSDLSQSKVRPAVCLADAGRGDWVLCQITSSPYGDPAAVALGRSRFCNGWVASEQLRQAGQAVYSSRWVDGPLGRRPYPGRVAQGAVRGGYDTPASGESITPSDGRRAGDLRDWHRLFGLLRTDFFTNLRTAEGRKGSGVSFTNEERKRPSPRYVGFY